MKQSKLKVNAKITLLLLISLMGGRLLGQTIIYTDQVTAITGIWNVNCSISEVNTQSPFEGSNHYKIDYTGADYWAGVGLNLNNWGSSASLDLSAFNTIRIAYKGLGSDQNFRLSIRDEAGISNEIFIGSQSNDYQIVEISIFELIAGTTIDLGSITEIDLSMGADVPAFSGTVFFDAIEFFHSENESIGSPATFQTWSRFAKMEKGVNFANWLEAFWLIPFNAYPEVNKFDRNQVQSLIDQGFHSVRLPVAFEQVASENSPYTIPQNSIIWSLIDSCISWAVQMDFSMIITNHHGFELTDQNYTSEIPRIQAIWSQVMDKYQDIDPERFFFELFNEPVDISSANLHAVYDSAIYTIRQAGAEHTLIAGGNGYNGVDGLLASSPFLDSNIIYTIHSYDPYFFTHQGMSWTTPPYFPAVTFPNSSSDSLNISNVIKAAKQWSDLHSVPVMLGEFGASTSADLTSRCNYIDVMLTALDEYDVPWYYWDAISTTDAFGFINGQNIEPCFEVAMNLGNQSNCPLHVTTKANEGNGSLREQILCASSGDTITFDLGLVLDTIQLQTLPIFLSKDIYLHNDHLQPIYFSHEVDSPLFYNGVENIATFKNMHLIGSGKTILPNYGTIILNDLGVYIPLDEKLNLSQGTFIFENEVKVFKIQN